MKNIISFFCLLFLSVPHLSSQDFFVITASKKIYKVTEDGSQFLTTVNIPASNGSIDDIAIAPDGRMFGINKHEIIEIDLESGDFEVVVNIFPHSSVSLVCSHEYELYLISGYDLYKYNLQTDSLEMVSTLGLNTPGDLTFYKGNIIFPTRPDNMFMAFNLESQNLSPILCFEELVPNFLGITMTSYHCDSTRVIVPSLNFFHPEKKLASIDLVMGFSESYEGEYFFDQSIFGMASSEEFLGSTCESVDLTEEDCTPILTSLDPLRENQILNIYPNPAQDILHIMGLGNEGVVKIFNNSGALLKSYYNPSATISITDISPGYYLISLGNSEIQEFQRFIKQ